MNLAFCRTVQQQKKGCCKLLTLNKYSVQQWLKSFDAIIYDADGVLWRTDKELEGASATFNALRAMGKRAYICTNNSTKSHLGICKKAQDMGILIEEHEVLTSAQALARFLAEKKFKKKVYIMGEEGIGAELRAVGIEHLPIGKEVMFGPDMYEYAKAMPLDKDVGAIAVGEDRDFSVPKLTKVACYLTDPSVMFLATNRDIAFPVAKGRYVPGAGVLVATVKAITKRAPMTCGKPNPYMCNQLLREGNIKPERTLMVGDTVYTDIQFGYNCGFQTLLVGSGVSTLDDVKKLQSSKQPRAYQQVPDLYVPKLSDLLKFLPSRNG
ncbi:glycerol-3-phosphate phosphatase [Scaptodrosophila lebanonensis]|uniref:Glycerol-3-phosphate phosphatase n=1 Tax=Drosophila lebanonensis TaxID=7225 RepID=A0A6J2TCG1_DROLE|nr:glycerol-3-phosphate phosphatase [Scaptodrosophila lebanonensis]